MELRRPAEDGARRGALAGSLEQPPGCIPRLGEHQTFALRADPPRRASVNELGGSDVLAPGYLYHYTLDATQAGPT